MKRIISFIVLVTIISSLINYNIAFAFDDDSIKNLTISYYLDSVDGIKVHETYIADMKKGSSYEIKSPEVKDLTLKDDSQKIIKGTLNENTEINVIYSYSKTLQTYKVTYIGVDSLGNEIILDELQAEGNINEEVSIEYREFKGYNQRNGQTMKLFVTSDGKAAKNIYYDKKEEKPYIIFKTSGSYVESIMAKAGEDISEQINKIVEPERKGYKFIGWDTEIPTIMPEENLVINAKWEPIETEYNVLYWIQNAEDDEYSLIDNTIRTGITDSKVTATEEDELLGKTMDTASKFFGFDYSHADEITVDGNGKSVLNIYYDREIWSIVLLNNDNSVWKTFEGKYGSKVVNAPTNEELNKHYDNISGRKFIGLKNGTTYVSIDYFDDYNNTVGNAKQFIVRPYYDNNIYKINFEYFIEDIDGNGYELERSETWAVDSNPNSGQYDNTEKPNYGFTWKGGLWKTGKTIDAYENANNIYINYYSSGKYRFNPVYEYSGFYMKRIRSNVEFMSNGVEVEQMSNIPYEKEIDITTIIPKNGNENEVFAGWYIDPNIMEVTEPISNMKMPANDVTLYAKWVPVDRTVTFDSDGGSQIQTQKITSGDKATEPEIPVKSGYTFIGWYDEDGNLWSFDIPISKDITLHARWRENIKTSYTVEHIMNGEETPFYAETKEGMIGNTVLANAIAPDDEKYPEGAILDQIILNKSIVLDKESTKNKITFVYNDKEEKNYTVFYKDITTNEEIKEAKKVTTLNTVVTEKAIDIENYKTNMIYQTVNIKENNEITFFYESINNETNNIPVINAEDKTIVVGSKFDPLDGVTANDKEDGDITNNIKVISNNVDVNKEGNYEVIYEIEDSQGAKATKKVIIKVVSKDIVDEGPEVDKTDNNINNENLNNTKPIEELPNTGVESYVSLLGVISLMIGGAMTKKSKRND